MSTQLTEVIYDIATEETITRSYTQNEIEAALQEKALQEKELANLIKMENARNAAKAKLAALGLTQDDLTALGF